MRRPVPSELAEPNFYKTAGGATLLLGLLVIVGTTPWELGGNLEAAQHDHMCSSLLINGTEYFFALAAVQLDRGKAEACCHCMRHTYQ